jgi:hypothetical protein
VRLDGPLGDEEGGGESHCWTYLGDLAQHVLFTSGEDVEVTGAVPFRHAAGDDRRIDDALVVGESPERVEQQDAVGDPILEEVTGRSR